MQYIEAPSEERPESMTLFLAGGITNCPDWQSQLVKMLSEKDITIYNPRRKNFPIYDSEAAYEQIKWEYEHLNRATFISFWFCKETLCPIVLYELGRHLVRGRAEIFIGMDPDYKRRQDVEIQTELEAPEIEIVYSLVDLCEQIKDLI